MATVMLRDEVEREALEAGRAASSLTDEAVAEALTRAAALVRERRAEILAANEAEKAANINILEVQAFGSFGRIYLGGEEQDIMAGYGAALASIEGVVGRENPSGRKE